MLVFQPIAHKYRARLKILPNTSYISYCYLLFLSPIPISYCLVTAHFELCIYTELGWSYTKPVFNLLGHIL